MCRRCKTVARAQETESSDELFRGGEDCVFSFSELSQFMISSPLNSIEEENV